MDFFGLIAFLFDLILVTPITNILVAIAWVFGGNFGIAIIIFTVVTRFALWPLTSSQYKQSRAMQEIQPKVQELQKRYKGKDPKKMQAEMMALYREAGINPLGCIFPLLAQMPIWIALYRVIGLTVGETPESLVTLSQRLYPIPIVHNSVPLDSHFLIWNLGVSDPTYILPVLVGLTMYVQQKMVTPTARPQGQLTQQQLQQQQTQQMMTWMMPLMFAYFTLNVPAGLGLYWFVSNLASMIIQYFYLGRKVNWGDLLRLGPPTQAAPKTALKADRPKQPAPKNEAREPEIADDGATDDGAPGDDTGGADGSAPQVRRKRHGRRRGKR
jgi:YidC/Oxa1 family membrane protein insertase